MMTSTIITLICVIVLLFGGTIAVFLKALKLQPVSEEEMKARLQKEGVDISETEIGDQIINIENNSEKQSEIK